MLEVMERIISSIYCYLPTYIWKLVVRMLVVWQLCSICSSHACSMKHMGDPSGSPTSKPQYSSVTWTFVAVLQPRARRISWTCSERLSLFRQSLEVSKMGLVVQLVSMYCFSTTPLLSTLRVNFMYVSPNIVYFGHSSRLFALILCQIRVLLIVCPWTLLEHWITLTLILNPTLTIDWVVALSVSCGCHDFCTTIRTSFITHSHTSLPLYGYFSLFHSNHCSLSLLY